MIKKRQQSPKSSRPINTNTPRIQPRAKTRTATKEMINKFEQLLGFKLPKEYSQFLQRNNGGVVAPRAFVYRTPSGKQKECGVDAFFHLGTGVYSLEETVKSSWREKAVPGGYLPIARDIFGDYICLSLRGKDIGKIKFCPTDLGLLETGADGCPTEASTSLIAPSLTKFLSMLQEEEEP